MLSYPREVRATSLDLQCHLHEQERTLRFGAAMEDIELEEGLDVQTWAHPHQYHWTLPIPFSSCIS